MVLGVSFFKMRFLLDTTFDSDWRLSRQFIYLLIPFFQVIQFLRFDKSYIF
jgi:hypothetical protein